MSETPTAPTSSIMRHKVAGVPFIYVAAAGVLLLVIVAYRMKGSATTPLVDPIAADPSAGVVGGDVYPNMPKGTVIVAPAAASGPGVNSSIQSNDDWLRAGVAYLITKGNGPGIAQEALQAYLNGDHLSFSQGVMRDQAIRELGLPPQPPFSGGADPDVPHTPLTPPAPTPPPIVIPPVNTPVPITNGSAYDSAAHDTYMTTRTTTEPTGGTYGELGNPYDTSVGMPAAQRRAALLASGANPDEVWVNYPNLPMRSARLAGSVAGTPQANTLMSQRNPNTGAKEYMSHLTGQWQATPDPGTPEYMWK